MKGLAYKNYLVCLTDRAIDIPLKVLAKTDSLLILDDELKNENVDKKLLWENVLKYSSYDLFKLVKITYESDYKDEEDKEIEMMK